jgi:hypothetical protein
MGREREAQIEFDKVKKLAAEEAPPPLVNLTGGLAGRPLP